jgi:hypothetical protein
VWSYDKSRIAEKARATENHPRHRDILDGLDERLSGHAHQVGEVRMEFSHRRGM